MPRGSWVLAFSCCFLFLAFTDSRVPQEEVDALREIVTKMGARYWDFSADSCQLQMVGLTPVAPRATQGIVESEVECECEVGNNSICHITKIVIRGYSLPGTLPAELTKLPEIKYIDFAYNFLNGTVPAEWGSTKLDFISVLANRLSGNIPKELGNISSLTYLNLELNQFSGNVPSELGNLMNLKTLLLSSNKFTGNLPASFSRLVNLTDFRINDSNFSGSIPTYIQNWKDLTRLEMFATGLEGPIPTGISVLNKLTDLRISEIRGPIQGFPVLRNMTGIVRLILRNCNISGEVPAYIWTLGSVEMIDLSFNKLIGTIPDDVNSRTLRFLFLTGNLLSGNIPDSILQDGRNIDLSYNNFTWQGPQQPACRSNMNLYINLYKSSSTGDMRRRILPCTEDFTCPRYKCSLHVNCGGNNANIRESNGRTILYEGDADVEGNAARYYRTSSYWGFSSTGDFLDDNNYQNTRFVASLQSTSLSELYRTARLSPLSLAYFHYCLENGNYTVTLHFAEILFSSDNNYSSLGRRIFDIYIQDELVWKDFNIEDKVGAAQKPLIQYFNASVTDNFLEVRFYWAGKGTTRIPNRGVYGPLVSAISVSPNFKSCSLGGQNKKRRTVYIAVGVVAVSVFFLVLGILWLKCCSQGRKGKDFEGLELQTVSFSLKQIKAATNNFDAANKIGEGGFGPVYKGLLSDGTIIAVKQLSSKSRQGNREFLNEIGMISCFQHPNLVKLHGCCIEGDQLMLVYEYMANNSLAHALFESANSQVILDWPTRFRICIGIAKGLAFLHEESRLKIVHRDIKATNVLLDSDLNPKISDFGLARLNEDDKTHISTRVAGTIGYMAPEYALWGYLTYKADVYSFGVVVLEIVSGKSNNNYMPSNNCVCLLDWASQLHRSENLGELVDRRLGSQFNKEEAERMVKIALLCTNTSPSLRPTMSEVVKMLEGEMAIPDIIPETSTDDVRFKAMRDFHQEKQNQSSSGSQTQNSTTLQTDMGYFSTSSDGQIEIKPDARP